MSSNRRRSSDGSAEAAGCVLVLATLGLVLIWRALQEVFRYRPQPYCPAAPNVAGESGLAFQDKSYIVRSLLLASGMLVLGLSQRNGVGAFAEWAGLYTAIGIFGLCMVGVRYYLGARKQVRVSERDVAMLYPHHPSTYSIYVPRAAENLNAGMNLMRSLLDIHPHLAFQIVADGTSTVWQVVDPQGRVSADQLSSAIRSHYRDAVVDTLPLEPPQSNQTPSVFQLHLYFRLANEFPAPIASLDMLKLDDPLIPITRRMDFLRPEQHERLIYTLLVTTASEVARTRAWERLKEGKIVPLASVPTQREDDNLHDLDERLLNSKLSGTLYHAFLVVTLESDTPARLKALADIVTDVTRFGIPRHNHLAFAGESRVLEGAQSPVPLTSITGQLYAGELLATDAFWRSCLLVLQPAELAALWHVPDDRFTAEQIEWAGRPIPQAVTQAGDGRVLLGTTVGRGSAKPVYLSLTERAHHLYLTGKTGVGKSTLLHNLIHQDILAGRGVAVLDPHGKLIDAILERSVPPGRLNDVVFLDCAASERPVPLNPFRVPDGVSFASADTYVYWVMRKIYEGIWNEGRMDMVMRNVIQALLTDPEATPLDIDRLLTHDRYREAVIKRMKTHDEVSFGVINYWQEFASKSGGQKREIAQPILNRTRAFVGNRTLEGMTCNPQGLNFQSLIRERKIVLIRLAGDAIRNEVGSLGAIFFAGFYLASESLGYLPDNAPPRFYLYVDEVERFITTPLTEMFAQARKFGLSLTLANQFLNQLPKETLEGIFGNVGTHILFEVGHSDAHTLEPLLKPEMKSEMLLNLGQFRMVVKTRAEGRTLPAFVVAGNHVPTSVGRMDGMNTMPFPTGEEVRAWLNQRYTSPPAPKSGEGETQSQNGQSEPDANTKDGLADYE